MINKYKLYVGGFFANSHDIIYSILVAFLYIEDIADIVIADTIYTLSMITTPYVIKMLFIIKK